MAGKIIIDTIDTDNAFITLNVQQSLIATMNVSGIYSNTGVKMIGANGTISNTAITGNITSSQITSNPTFYGNVSVTGAIGVGGATPTSNGSGITFPATQSASSDANTLDDYEEGTWTPNQGPGLTVVGAFSSSGTYTKIGRVVTVNANYRPATTVAVAGGGVAMSTNLPFTGVRNETGVVTNDAQSVTSGLIINNASSLSTGVIPATPNIYWSATYTV